MARSLMTLSMFFTPFKNSEVIRVDMFLQDLTLLCIFQYRYQYLFSQKTSLYCGFIKFIKIAVGL